MPADLVIVCALTRDLDLEEILPGSRILRCSSCRRTITMAPTTSRLVDTQQQPVTNVCPDCAYELLEHDQLRPHHFRDVELEAIFDQRRPWWQRWHKRGGDR